MGTSGSKSVTVVGIEAERLAEGSAAIVASLETSATTITSLLETGPGFSWTWESQVEGALTESLGLSPPRQMLIPKPGVIFFYKRSDRKRNRRQVTKIV